MAVASLPRILLPAGVTTPGKPKLLNQGSRGVRSPLNGLGELGKPG